MRYKKCEHCKATERWEVSSRRIAAARRAINRQQAQLALFADQVRWPTPEERIEKHDTGFAMFSQDMRDKRARDWRYVRAFIRSIPQDVQRTILDEWSKSHCPGEPSYLWCKIRKHVAIKWNDQEKRYEFTSE